MRSVGNTNLQRSTPFKPNQSINQSINQSTNQIEAIQAVNQSSQTLRLGLIDWDTALLTFDVPLIFIPILLGVDVNKAVYHLMGEQQNQ